MNHTCSDALTNGSYINHSKLLTFKIGTLENLQSTTEIRNIPHHLCGIHHHLLSGSLLDAYTCPQSTQLQGHFPTQPDFIRGGRNLPNIVWLINVGCKWLHYIYEIYKNVYSYSMSFAVISQSFFLLMRWYELIWRSFLCISASPSSLLVDGFFPISANDFSRVGYKGCGGPWLRFRDIKVCIKTKTFRETPQLEMAFSDK